MAKTIIVARKGHTLVPENPWSLELLEGFPEGKPLSIELKASRSKGELNLYWAGLAVLIDNFSEADEKKWPTPRHYHEAMLEALGYTYKLWRIDGRFRVMIDSIALDKMDDDDFKALFEKVRALTQRLFRYSPWDSWLEMRGTDWMTYWEKRQQDRRNWREGDTD